MAAVFEATGHRHDHGAESDYRRRFAAPDSSRRDRPGPDDDAQLAELYDAALDNCRPCQEHLIDLVAQNTHTTTDLVNWACVITAETYGYLPDAVLHDDDKADLFPEPFRRLARTYQDRFMTGTDYRAMLPLCSSMTCDQRRQAAAAAVGLAVGLGDFGVDFPFQ
ncbi:hypothetical protein ACGRHY_29350 [Streptomyces sp. HK10]|uniref:hypothetical protein n=1 Tax=Streptomyces sp. HK10 TaxID=3373255 RepID=UPI003749CE56